MDSDEALGKTGRMTEQKSVWRFKKQTQGGLSYVLLSIYLHLFISLFNMFYSS